MWINPHMYLKSLKPIKILRFKLQLVKYIEYIISITAPSQIPPLRFSHAPLFP